MMKIIFAWSLLLICAAQNLFAAPARVVIMRHAEKPASGSELNERGFLRAKALVDFFKTSSEMTKYGVPVAVYAMAPKGEDGTLRPIQTVIPLAQSLGLEIKKAYNKKHVAALVSEIMRDPAYEGRTVVVCWAHDGIPDIVEAFGWTGGPDKWPGPVFDRAWVIDFSGDRAVAFTDVAEHLLPGDSER